MRRKSERVGQDVWANRDVGHSGRGGKKWGRDGGRDGLIPVEGNALILLFFANYHPKISHTFF